MCQVLPGYLLQMLRAYELRHHNVIGYGAASMLKDVAVDLVIGALPEDTAHARVDAILEALVRIGAAHPLKAVIFGDPQGRQ